VFEPADVERLATVYEQTLRALRLKDRSDPITQLVAENIIATGRLGIEGPAEISKLALGDPMRRKKSFLYINPEPNCWPPRCLL
jgi:hypothetical protein